MRGESKPSLGVYIHTGLLWCPVECRFSLNMGKLSQIFINSSQTALERYSIGLLSIWQREKLSCTVVNAFFLLHRRPGPKPCANPVYRVLLRSSVFDRECKKTSRRECKKKSQHTQLNTSWLHPESTSGVSSAQSGCILPRCSPCLLASPASSSWSKTVTKFEGRQLGVCKG